MKKYPFWARGQHHLNHSNMSYWYHLWHSFYNGTRLIWFALTSYIHGIFPWVFKFHAAKGVMRVTVEVTRLPHLKKAYEEIQAEYKDDKTK